MFSYFDWMKTTCILYGCRKFVSIKANTTLNIHIENIFANLCTNARMGSSESYIPVYIYIMTVCSSGPYLKNFIIILVHLDLFHFRSNGYETTLF